MINRREEFNKWLASQNEFFTQNELDRMYRGLDSVNLKAMYNLFCQVCELSQDAERYRFIRDTDNWGEDSPNEDNDTWDDLTSAHCQEFDRIVDSRMQKEL